MSSGKTLPTGSDNDGSPSDRDRAAAEKLGYEILSVLGRGAMGVVYRARQTDLDRIVALKTVQHDRLNDARSADRFRREALAVARLQHPTIVQALNYGVVDNVRVFAMELIDGPTCDQWISRHGPMKVRAAWDIVRQTAGGLLHASRHGVLHRDIKPSNLIILPMPDGAVATGGIGAVKITDFGLASLNDLSSADDRLTGDGHFIGSPAYMAPERFDDEIPSDIRADIYSLGVTLVTLRTGRHPFAKGSLPKLVTQKSKPLSLDAPQLHSLAPRETQLVLKMLAPSVGDRIENYETLIQSLDTMLMNLANTPLSFNAANPNASNPNASNPYSASRRSNDDSSSVGGTVGSPNDRTWSDQADQSRSSSGGDVTRDSSFRGGEGLPSDEHPDLTETLESGSHRLPKPSPTPSATSSSTNALDRNNDSTPDVSSVSSIGSGGGASDRTRWKRIVAIAILAITAMTVLGVIVLKMKSPTVARTYTKPYGGEYLFEGKSLSGFLVGGSMTGSWSPTTNADGGDVLTCFSPHGEIIRPIPCGDQGSPFRLAAFIQAVEPAADPTVPVSSTAEIPPKIDLDFALTAQRSNDCYAVRCHADRIELIRKYDAARQNETSLTEPLVVDLTSRPHVIHIECQPDGWFVFFEETLLLAVPSIVPSEKRHEANQIRFVIDQSAEESEVPTFLISDLQCMPLKESPAR